MTHYLLYFTFHSLRTFSLLDWVSLYKHRGRKRLRSPLWCCVCCLVDAIYPLLLLVVKPLAGMLESRKAFNSRDSWPRPLSAHSPVTEGRAFVFLGPVISGQPSEQPDDEFLRRHKIYAFSVIFCFVFSGFEIFTFCFAFSGFDL